MKLITEEVSQVKFITEKYKGNKRLCIEGVFLQGGIKNRNGRMYPGDILEREVNRYNSTFVKQGRALGELGDVPQDEDLDAEGQITDAEYQKDTKTAEI